MQPTEGFLDLPCVCFIVPLPPTTKLQKDHSAKVVCIERKSVLLYFYFYGTTHSYKLLLEYNLIFNAKANELSTSTSVDMRDREYPYFALELSHIKFIN